MILDRIDDLLDRVTMYRLVVFYLAGILAVGFALGFVGAAPADPAELALSAVLVVAVSLATNWVFARVYRAPQNPDSALITALILVLIMGPAAPRDIAGLGALVFVAVWAMASKYMLAIGRRHIFNPAALAVAMSSVLLDQAPSWWSAGNAVLLPVVLAGGMVVVRKLKRADLLLSYFIAAIAAVMATSAGNEVEALTNTLLYSPLLFVGFIMLTEPLTTPTMRSVRIAYGVVVGVLAAPNLHVGSFYFTPEGALLIGNLVAYVLSPQRSRLELTLLRIERSAASVYDYVFGADRRLSFQPGQYLEFGLGLAHSDSRGNRRFFTIASSPAEKDIRLGVKFNAPPSAFKRALADMKPGDKIYGWQLAGDFVLPADRKEKLAFIAGGIGITPFRSQLRDLLDRRERRPIVLLYAADTSQDFAYRDVISAAEHQLGVLVAYTVAREETPPAGVGRGLIDEALIRREVPDYAERTFYISGPRAMVVACETALQRLGVTPARVRVDFFPGLA